MGDLVNTDNYGKIFYFVQYLQRSLNIDNNKLQVIFSPNVGMDIGGFFFLMEQLIKQDIKHDFIVKLHTKTDNRWRALLTSFLNVHINPLLNNYECIYSNRLYYNLNDTNEINVPYVTKLLDQFGLPHKNFYFCGGTMFIMSNKITEFFKQFDFSPIYSMLHNSKSEQLAAKKDLQKKGKDGLIEHAFERLFGFLTIFRIKNVLSRLYKSKLQVNSLN